MYLIISNIAHLSLTSFASLAGPDPLAEAGVAQLHPIAADVRWAEDYLAGMWQTIFSDIECNLGNCRCARIGRGPSFESGRV